MEQKTEAPKAVDDTVERGKFVTEYLRYMAKEAPQSHPEMVYSMAHTRWDGIAGVMWRAGRAALKAQPALTEAAQGAQLSGNSGELQPSGNTGELAQGEDSVRLDFIAAHGCDGGDYGDSDWYVAGETYHGITLREAIDRARASAETGGVKP